MGWEVAVLAYRVLIADDEPDIRNLVSIFLQKNGYTVFTAKNGREAVGELRQNGEFDLVIMDIMMPDMDGIETLNELRNNNIVSDDTPIVALTANAIVGAKEIYIEAGFTDYLSKPIEYERLNKMLINLLPDKLIYTDL